MMTATTGRPIIGRSTTRSSPKPKATIRPSPPATAAGSGAPYRFSMAATAKPAIITSSPWAKLMASVAL